MPIICSLFKEKFVKAGSKIRFSLDISLKKAMLQRKKGNHG
jgi:hypothetical protein